MFVLSYGSAKEFVGTASYAEVAAKYEKHGRESHMPPRSKSKLNGGVGAMGRSANGLHI